MCTFCIYDEDILYAVIVSCILDDIPDVCVRMVYGVYGASTVSCRCVCCIMMLMLCSRGTSTVCMARGCGVYDVDMRYS